MTEPLVIRADATEKMGSGHVMRCIALAQEWSAKGGRVVFACRSLPPFQQKRVKEEGFDFFTIDEEPGSDRDALKTAEVSVSEGAGWVVVDGYHFADNFQRLLKERGLKILFIDDYKHSQKYCADIILNQNLYASSEMYENHEPYTRVLCGPRFALLRREFVRLVPFQRIPREKASKILVSLGGFDFENVTLKVLSALSVIGSPAFDVIICSSSRNPHLDFIVNVARNSAHRISVMTDVKTMDELMLNADIGIVSASTTSYEIAFTQLPSLLIVNAQNQELIAKSFHDRKAAISLGWHDKMSDREISRGILMLAEDSNLRSEISKSCRSLLDGRGALRVAEAIAQR